MKILLYDWEFLPSNGEMDSTTFHLLREYAKDPEFEIDVIAASNDDKYHLLKMGDNVNVHCLPPSINKQSKLKQARHAWRAYKFSQNLAKEKQYDLAHALGSFPDGLTAWLLERKTKVPYLVSAQAIDLFYRSSMFLKNFIKKIWDRAYFVVADESKLQAVISQALQNKEVDLITKGVDVETFFPGAVAHGSDLFTIFCPTQLTPLYGVRFLIQAFHILAARYSQLHMVILGEGSERQSLQDLARGLGLESKVEFVSEATEEQITAYYQTADVFVLPALSQACDTGNQTRNALAFGLPVVLTSVNGKEELLVDGNNGFLAAEGSADDLVEKIEKLILDEKLRKAMAQNSLLLAQKLSWANIAKAYEDLYIKTKNLSHIREA